ncbi:restriction endonuclease subunit S, partial [Patescibacteria group bacterium]|nr:restriction endonuclease subunit S [Patescibacteria group bacterium]
ELKDKMCFVVYANDVKNNRCDVYYYQPKFKEIEKALSKGKFDLMKIGDKINLLNQVGKFKDIFEINYVDLSSIDKISGYVTKTKNMIVRDAPSRAKQKIEKGDLLISSLSGSLKSISVYDREDKNSVASTGFHIIKDSEMYNNYYLFALFRTPLFQNLIQRETTGAIMSAINKDSFKQIKIPLPPLSVQNKIAEEVKKRMQKAEQLRKEAKEELEKAKQEVEKIILG